MSSLWAGTISGPIFYLQQQYVPCPYLTISNSSVLLWLPCYVLYTCDDVKTRTECDYIKQGDERCSEAGQAAITGEY